MPSAVSRLIDRMENRLGVRPLQRTSCGLALTQEGRNFRRCAVRVLENISDTGSTLSEANAPAMGLLRVRREKGCGVADA